VNPNDGPHTEGPAGADLPAPEPADAPPVLDILFLCDYAWKNTAGTIIDHCQAFQRYSRHNYFYVNPVMSAMPTWLNLNHFDVIIIHYSIYTLGDTYLNAKWRAAIRDSGARKVLFIQDEYRQVNAFIERMKELSIDVLYTCYPPGEIDKVYTEQALPGVTKISTLTGYVPAYLACRPQDFDSPRPIDVGYRGRQPPLWLGHLGQEKRWITERFLECAPAYGLKCDISSREADRIYGNAWQRFLRSCACVLGTESGASVVDFTGDIERKVQAHLARRPGASFEEVRDRFFKDEEDKIRMNQISPRVFESIACGACLVLFEGEYSGILAPWVHFIPLKKDFSNIEEVAAKIKDRDFTRAMARKAHEDVIGSGLYSYKAFIGKFDRDLDALFGTDWPRSRAALARPGGRVRRHLGLALVALAAPMVVAVQAGPRFARLGAQAAMQGARRAIRNVTYATFKALRLIAAAIFREVCFIVEKARIPIGHQGFRLTRHPAFLKEYFRTFLHAARSQVDLQAGIIPRMEVADAQGQVCLQADITLGTTGFFRRAAERLLGSGPRDIVRADFTAEGLHFTEWSHISRRWEMYTFGRHLCVLWGEVSAGPANAPITAAIPASARVRTSETGFVADTDGLALRGDAILSRRPQGNGQRIAVRKRRRTIFHRDCREYALSLQHLTPGSHIAWVLQVGQGELPQPTMAFSEDTTGVWSLRIQLGNEGYLLLGSARQKRRKLHLPNRFARASRPIALQYAGEQVDAIWAETEQGVVRFG